MDGDGVDWFGRTFPVFLLERECHLSDGAQDMIDDTQLDMLVDGELGDGERRELLSRLEVEPDGWRRCALAFLEAQTWRQAMQSVSGEAVHATAIRDGRRPPWKRFRAVLAMACGLLLALGVGAVIGNMFDRDRPIRLTEHVTEAPQVDESIDVEQPSVDVVPEAVPELDIPVQYVAIPTRNPANGEADSIQLPVVPQEYLGEGWPYRLPAVLPDDVVHTLERRGHEVVQQRRLVPFQAADGSRVVFPVDEVELLPVGNRGYQ